MKHKFILLLAVILGSTIVGGSAATIPSGAILQLRTTNSISSRDHAGKRFYGTLINNVSVNGNVVLPAGTKVTGAIESPRVAIGSTTRPMTLKLTEVSVRGHTVLISTHVFEAEAAGIYGRRGTRVSGNNFVFPPGTVLQFALNRAVSI
jgi:hypothetical protein